MYYPDRKEYITFLFSLLDEFAERKQSVISRGRPKVYSDASLVVFYVVMTLKQINKIRGQHRWLYMHPIMLETLRLPFCPSQATLARRYKALTPLLGEFCRFGSFQRMKIRVCSTDIKGSVTSIKPHIGRKVGITDASMDMDFI